MGSLLKEIKDIVELSLKGDPASYRKLLGIISNGYKKNRKIYGLLKLHEKNSYAQNNLGCLYHYGKKDYKMAFKYYKLSADQGNSYGQKNLGDMYYTGEGTERDLKMAFKYYKLSADQGISCSQFAVGNMYYNGEGTKQGFIIWHSNIIN